MKIGQTVYVRGHAVPSHTGIIVKMGKEFIKLKLPSGIWTFGQSPRRKLGEKPSKKYDERKANN